MLSATQEKLLETWLTGLATQDDHECQFFGSDISNLGPDAVPRLVEVLSDINVPSIVRTNVADVLGDIGDMRAAKPLFALLGTEDTDLAAGVIGALQNLKAPEPVQLLATLHDDDPRRRARTAELLGYFRTVEAVEPLLAMMNDPDEITRECVVYALGIIGDERGLPTALHAVGDGAGRVRRTAASVLGRFGGPESIDALLSLMQDEDECVRESACSALGKIGDRGVQDAILAATQDSEKRVREAAVWALCHIGDERAIPYLLRSLQDTHWACLGAVKTLGKIAGPEVISDLHRVQFPPTLKGLNDDVKKAIVHIKERHGLT